MLALDCSHGPFNSWDRVPFLTDVPAGPGSPTLTPLENEIHHNFLIANYESSMCVDNDVRLIGYQKYLPGPLLLLTVLMHDNYLLRSIIVSSLQDGSAYYQIHHNVCHGGGHKSDFAGHSKSTFASLEIGPKKDACIKVQPSQPTVPESYYNNTCIQLGVEDPAAANASAGGAALVYASVNGCNTTTGMVIDARTVPLMHSNRIFNTEGQASVQCASLTPPLGHVTMTMKDFQAQGFEKGSTVGVIPPVPEILALARRILGL